jgi:hypothetical protein
VEKGCFAGGIDLPSIDPELLPRLTLSRRLPEDDGNAPRLDLAELDRAAQAKPVAYVYAARALRDFGDGFVAVLLPVYLTAMGLGALEVGIVATLALLGSALMTLGSACSARGRIQRKLLMAASGLMIATGLAFAASSTYAVVGLVALFGTINPSSGSVSIFVPLEHASSRAPSQTASARECLRATA